jgi:hypothetical protein
VDPARTADGRCVETVSHGAKRCVPAGYTGRDFRPHLGGRVAERGKTSGLGVSKPNDW